MNLITNKMNNKPADGDLASNSEIGNKYNNCIDDVYMPETVISERSVKEEPRNAEKEQRSIHNYDPTVVTQDNELYTYATLMSGGCIKQESCDTEVKSESIHVDMKDVDIGDRVVTAQETEAITDSIDDKVCIYETLISGGYMKQEPYDMEDKSENTHVDIKAGNMGDRTIVAQKTELITDCIDDKVCKYETLINGGYIKQEPRDMEEGSGSIHNYANIKRNYVTCCKECGEAYDLYCLKCPMLVRIFNSDNSDVGNNALPKNFLDYRETSSGVDIVALRAIPKGVVFGPFKDFNLPKDNTVSKEKMGNREVANKKDPMGLNWIQYIWKADQSSHPNLTPLRYEDELYYRSHCHINMGDKLSTCWDSDKNDNGIQEVNESCWEPQVCESLDDTYACTLCCVGYKSISHLKAHNSVCCEKRNKTDFCEEIVQCDFCKIYMDKDEYSDYHINRCYKSNKKCVFKTRYSSNCGTRLRYHVNVKSIKCDSCNIPFRNTRLLVRHKKEVHAMVDKTYSCRKCKYRTHYQYAYRRHLAIVHDDSKVFPCTICNYTAKNNSVLKRHVATHDNEKAIACTLCPYKTTRTSTLKRHMATHFDDRPFVCELCPYKTTRNSSLIRHMATHYDDRPFACPLCSYTAKIKPALHKHMATHNADKLYACMLCPYKTIRKSNLNQHIAIHNDDRPFPCTLCPYKATTKSILKQHMATHNEDKSFACTICPYTASKKLALKRHIAAHNEVKSFACTLCPHKAMTKSNLTRHIATHSDDRPFACTLCSYTAKRKANLKLHIVSHNDDKRFECTLCPYKTKRKENLKQHLATHSDDRSFACTICSYRGSTNFALKRHIATHNDDRPSIGSHD